MTRAERDELAIVVRMRAKVARADVEARKAELLADFEEQLAATYRANDERWTHLTAAAEQAIAEADAQLADICRAEGIPPEFRPQVHLGWHGRGENAVASRRAELRKVAMSRLDAQARAAKAEIDRAEAALRGDLASRALDTEEARQWLERIPTPEQLMPRLELALLEEAHRG